MLGIDGYRMYRQLTQRTSNLHNSFWGITDLYIYIEITFFWWISNLKKYGKIKCFLSFIKHGPKWREASQIFRGSYSHSPIQQKKKSHPILHPRRPIIRTAPKNPSIVTRCCHQQKLRVAVGGKVDQSEYPIPLQKKKMG